MEDELGPAGARRDALDCVEIDASLYRCLFNVVQCLVAEHKNAILPHIFAVELLHRAREEKLLGTLRKRFLNARAFQQEHVVLNCEHLFREESGRTTLYVQV